ncbi:hypothetical protein D7Z26_20870 [Cohnella endophytica]|uniref:Uncharacterized protein n=1 Tax=Cohnella endophytica TaxID=2419778 RepID=A0A494XL10_9BACL|nr:hypothetical protein [Cohnella endophytica]RKP48829.1 hypothetical protein D7Z26_20870 [Cohnella endophytica]
MDFTYEILDPATINVRLNYGGEWFDFNLFHKHGEWILHPFDASLLGNPDMCRLVVADLLSNKPFQVMLAKERIMLSHLRTSVDVSGDGDGRDRIRGGRLGEEAEPSAELDKPDELEEWIASRTLEEILAGELQAMEDKLAFYNKLLQRMFYENLGPGDAEFDRIQEISRIYKDAVARFRDLKL